MVHLRPSEEGLCGGPEILIPEVATPAGVEVAGGLKLVEGAQPETIIGGGGAGFDGVGRDRVH